MGKIRVFTDSSSDIPKHVAEELQIDVVPLRIHMGEQTYVDGVTISAEELYEKIRTSDEVPTTSQPSPLDFQQAYQKAIHEGVTEILSIHLSSALSGTYQSACLAKSMIVEEHGDENVSITVMDSKTGAYALGMIVIAAAKAVEQGKGLAECLQLIERCMQEQSIYFVVDTLEYLQKGGRIGKAAALVGTLLNITPILSVNKEGEVYVADKVRGKKKAFQRVFDLMQDAISAKEISVAILHADNETEAKQWLEKVQSLFTVKESIIHRLGPLIGVHVGPGSLACAILPVHD